MTTEPYDQLTRAEQRRRIPQWQRDMLCDGLMAIDAPPEQEALLWQIYRAAGFAHAVATLRGWRGD